MLPAGWGGRAGSVQADPPRRKGRLLFWAPGGGPRTQERAPPRLSPYTSAACGRGSFPCRFHCLWPYAHLISASGRGRGTTRRSQGLRLDREGPKGSCRAASGDPPAPLRGVLLCSAAEGASTSAFLQFWARKRGSEELKGPSPPPLLGTEVASRKGRDHLPSGRSPQAASPQ